MTFELCMGERLALMLQVMEQMGFLVVFLGGLDYSPLCREQASGGARAWLGGRVPGGLRLGSTGAGSGGSTALLFERFLNRSAVVPECVARLLASSAAAR